MALSCHGTTKRATCRWRDLSAPAHAIEALNSFAQLKGHFVAVHCMLNVAGRTIELHSAVSISYLLVIESLAALIASIIIGQSRW